MSKGALCCAIVVTYNGMRWLEKCIQSLVQSELSVDILAVDNASTDGSTEYLKNLPNVNLIENKANLGFGHANNVGLEHAHRMGYQNFFLLNQDAWVKKETIGKLLEQVNQHPEYGILSPVHLDGIGKNLDPGFKKYMRLRPSSGFFNDFRNKRVEKKIYEVSFVNAAAWMISRNALTETGLFHPLFDHYGEDDNFVHRVLSKGLKVGVLGGISIFHDRTDRFKIRIDPYAKFRSMVLMAHLNPLKERGKWQLWFVSMGNLFAIRSFWYFFPNLRFYCWGIASYIKFANEVKTFGSKDFNPLIK